MLKSLELQTAHTEEVRCSFSSSSLKSTWYIQQTDVCFSAPSSDAFLERVATEKRISLIKAWEENEKAKVENK
jgi:hypothetical protein